jgi:glycyl-tRNA synthetase
MNKISIFNKNNYISPSYSHYGGLAGFQDYGNNGIKLKTKLIECWRQWFTREENIFEIEVPAIMPYNILKASGHVDKFTDYVTCDRDGIEYRADHLVKNFYKDDASVNVDAMTQQELCNIINEKKLVNLEEGCTAIVTTKNLMFNMTDNTGNNQTFLRPELAQGIIVNFNRYLINNNYSMPLGIASVGKSYRNEISCKHLTRLREFTQAELEYFVDPENKSDPKILSSLNPDNIIPTSKGDISVGDLSKQVASYTMLSFIVKVYKFVISIGLKHENIRFRKHEENEMAHYAVECWDLECNVNDDWLEVIGIADRGTWDTAVHSKGVGSVCPVVARRILAVPKITVNHAVELNKKTIAKVYGKHMKLICDYVMNNNDNIINEVKINSTFTIKTDSDILKITEDMFKILSTNKVETFEEYYPNIIEPSFGIDRLIYSILMQNSWNREDTSKGIRTVLSLPIKLSPYQLAIFVLLDREDLYEMLKDIKTKINNKYEIYYDYSTTKIGKKYVRADEIGVPLVITIDVQSLTDQSVTIRDRDTMQQVRVLINDLNTSLVNMIGY